MCYMKVESKVHKKFLCFEFGLIYKYAYIWIERKACLVSYSLYIFKVHIFVLLYIIWAQY